VSYQVLARKWRPQTFQEVIGQPHVLTALENGLAQNRLHHAYLFSGTRGVGKTTIARLLAKSLNCELGVTATPCGKCVNCEAIDQGRFVDLLEIDAASRTKVDDTRELLDNVQYKPAQGRYKVYLIDEVHMLSKHSFNALLKTLEEPPEYVKFLLATTDPQKLPITVLSRCLQFHLKAILPEQIEQQLAAILKHEQATFEQPALGVIAKAADGSMRDALSLTDQALAFGAGHIEYAAVLKMLGTIDQSHLHYLLHFVASGDSQKVFKKIEEFVHLGADFSALHQELASLCHQIALAQLQLNANVSKKTAVQLLAERLTPEEVQLFYQIALQGYKDYAYAPNGKVALEMTVMRLLAFKPANYIDIDESMLLQAQQADTIEASHEGVPPSVLSARPVTNNNEELNASIDVDPQPVGVISSKQDANDKSFDHNTQSHLNDESAAVEEQVEPTAAPSIESSNSRNMLRSHRLKREALKKGDAATENVVNTNDQLVAPVIKLDAHVLTKPASEVAPLDAEETLSKVSEGSVKSDLQNVDIQPSSRVEKDSADDLLPDDLSVEQELPPLSSYSDQSIQQEYMTEYVEHDDPSMESHYFDEYSINRTDTNLVNTGAVVNGPVQGDDVHHQSKLVESTADTPSVLKEKTLVENPEKKINDDISELNQDGRQLIEVVLINNENLKGIDIDITRYVENKMTDPWSLAIKEMSLVGLEKLLAKSSVMQQNEKSIVLTLNESQQHLMNNHRLCNDLKEKLLHYYGQEYNVHIETGKVAEAHTPSELELIVYQEYLEQAKSSIKNDLIVQTFVRDFSAKVYENSVVPL
jgi:DNA polymerase-3 subunit gamma/tau